MDRLTPLAASRRPLLGRLLPGRLLLGDPRRLATLLRRLLGGLLGRLLLTLLRGLLTLLLCLLALPGGLVAPLRGRLLTLSG